MCKCGNVKIWKCENVQMCKCFSLHTDILHFQHLIVSILRSVDFFKISYTPKTNRFAFLSNPCDTRSKTVGNADHVLRKSERRYVGQPQSIL